MHILYPNLRFWQMAGMFDLTNLGIVLQYSETRMYWEAMRTVNAYEQHAGLIRATAHPVRLQILEILARGECCVCHLTAILRRRQPCVSQHLMVLRESGLVVDRRDGVRVYYRLADPRIANVISLTREMLRSAGVEAEPLTVPALPVHGCACPKCAN